PSFADGESGRFVSLPSPSRRTSMDSGASGYRGVQAQTSHRWLRYEPPNAAMKKLSAKVYSAAHCQRRSWLPSKYPITQPPTVDIAANMLFLPPLICSWL